ncbi:MAG TPA: hypothetical protein VGE41_06690 [Verrucomicrobiae bacterium]
MARPLPTSEEKMRVLFYYADAAVLDENRVSEMHAPPRIGEFLESGQFTWRVERISYTPEDPNQDAIVYLKKAQ